LRGVGRVKGEEDKGNYKDGLRIKNSKSEDGGALRPWEQLTGQIYLGSDDFVAQHQPNRVIQDIPRRQTQARGPHCAFSFSGKGSGLKQAEQANV
jgi:putative transposase